jgi:putative ABC transport system permease protein
MWARIRSLARGLWSRSTFERDLDDELRFHLEARVDDLMKRRNLSAGEARRLARIEFGSLEKYKEEGREARGLRLIDALRADLRYSVRQLGKYPVFAAAAVLTLALGIGPNAAMATIIGSVFRPLPVADPQQMTCLATTLSGNPRIWQRLAYPDYRDYKSSSTAFLDMAAWDVNPVGLTADGRTDRLIATVVSGSYFSTLRLDPAAGRLILPSDGELGGTDPIVVLSHSYWMRRFDGSASVVGKEVRIDGRPFTVVGVAPERFHGTFTLLSSDAYLPLALFQSAERLANRDVLSVRVIARLKPQTELGQARASIDTVARQLERDHPTTNAGRRVRVYSERLARPEPQNESQGLVFAALFLLLVGGVLLIACANVLGLFLARGLGRGREMAIRAALGASRWDLVRLCLVEALVIGGIGAVAGAAAGLAVARALAALAVTPGFPLFLDFRLDWDMLGYLAVLLMVSTLLIGFLPAIRAARVEPGNDLSGNKTSTENRRRQLLRKGLAAAQMAASVVLLVVCGLFIRSLQGLQSADLGFDATRVLLTSTDPGAVGFDAGRARSFYESLDARLEALPDVEVSATSVFLPFGNSNSTPYVAADGQPPPSSTSGVLTDRHFVSGDYFHAIGTPIVLGRTFTSVDMPGSPKVALVNEALATRLWPGRDPLGQHLRASTESDTGLEVIGVVRDARYRRGEIGGAAVPRFFVSLDQFPSTTRILHVRSRSGRPATLAAAVRAEIRRLDPAVPVYDVYTLDQHVRSAGGGFGGAMFAAMVTGVLGALALTLALVGTYGVLSFTVTARTREIGIRVALGLEPGRVFRMLLWETWSVALSGVGIGLALSIAIAQAMKGFLFGVVPYDPVTLLAVIVVMGVVSTLVGFVPARRAARVNPIETLRYE